MITVEAEGGRAMGDPAVDPLLVLEKIVHLATRAGNNYQVKKTPGLARATAGEKLVFGIILFGACTALYIHLDVTPFLPFELSPEVVNWLAPLTFVVAAVGAIFLLYFLFILIMVIIGSFRK